MCFILVMLPVKYLIHYATQKKVLKTHPHRYPKEHRNRERFFSENVKVSRRSPQ